MTLNLRDMIRQIVGEAIAEAFGGDTPDTARVEQLAEQLAAEPTVERASRRRRRTKPAVGYHLHGIDGRSVKSVVKTLAHNPAAVLGAVAAKPGSTNRELTAALGDEVGGKKAVESALYWLRTHDASGAALDLDRPADRKRALVTSKPLAENGGE